jgi:hypothetical protein
MAGRPLPLFTIARGAARVCQIVMKANVRAKQSAMLDADEASLRARLLAILPGVAAAGAQLFLNSTNSPKTIARYSHKEADALFVSAQHCMVLRENLGLDAEGSVADHFLIACREAASDDARRGPRKLAEWLLTKITS